MSVDSALQIFKRYGVDGADRLDKDKLKSARHALVMKHHPDITGGQDDEAIKLINSACDTLKDGVGTSGYSRGRGSYSDAHDRGSVDADQDPFPVWAQAGWSGGTKESGRIFRNSYSDLNFIKKTMWEKSDHSRIAYSVNAFDGHFFRGSFSVYGSSEIFPDMCEAMLEWEKYGIR